MINSMVIIAIGALAIKGDKLEKLRQSHQIVTIVTDHAIVRKQNTTFTTMISNSGVIVESAVTVEVVRSVGDMTGVIDDGAEWWN